MAAELDIYKNNVLIAYYTQSSTMMSAFVSNFGYSEEEQELTQSDIASVLICLNVQEADIGDKLFVYKSCEANLSSDALEDYMNTVLDYNDELKCVKRAVADLNFISRMYIDTDDKITYKIG